MDQEEAWGRHAQEVQARRKEIAISQEELAILGGFSRGTVKTAEAGRRLTDRTLPGLHYALGWKPRSSQQISEGVPARPVLSVAVMREIAQTIVHLAMRQSEPWGDGRADRARSELSGLVLDMAADPPASPSAPVLIAELRRRLSPGHLEDLASEIGVLGSAVPAALDVRPVGREWRGVSGLIAGSGLSAAAQAALFEHLSRRREQFEAVLLSETEALIEAAVRVRDA